MGYASELRKQLAESGFTAEQINGMLGGDDKPDVELDEVDPSGGGQKSGKSGSNMDVLKALSGGKGGGSGVSLKDMSQGISFSPASSGGTGLGSSGAGYSAPAGFDGYTGGSGISASSTGQGLQMGNTQGISYSPVSEGGTGAATSGGGGDSSGGGSWAGAVFGAINGMRAGKKNREEDPVMTSGKDGYGTYHDDYRADIGGGIVGGIMGYYGGGVGASLAEPVVKAIHPTMEKFTRTMINFGDSIDGAYGAEKVDPIGAWASGKYKNSDLIKSALFGGLGKYL